MKKGCVDRGNSKGDDSAKTIAYCDCAIGLLESNLSGDQWREATYASQNKQDSREASVFGPYMPQMRACRDKTN